MRLSRLLRMHLAVGSFPAEDLTCARVMLERTSAASAAERHSPADLARLREALAAMDADLPREEFNPLDTAFHVAIAESGGNRLVSELTRGDPRVAARRPARRPAGRGGLARPARAAPAGASRDPRREGGR